MKADLPDFGKARSDQAGSQDVSLPKLPAFASQKIVGKNAEQLQTLEDAIIQALRDQSQFGFELTSKNTDAILERVHAALEKLSLANGVNFEELAEELKAGGSSSVDDASLEKIRAAMREEVMSASTGMTEEQREAVASQLTAAVAAKLAESARVVENKVDELVSELRDFLSQAGGSAEEEDDEEGDESDAEPKGASIDTASLQKYLDFQFNRLDAKFKNFGESFKNSYLFGFKNPFTSVVGKITSPFKDLGDKIGTFAAGIGAKVGQTFKSIGDGIKNLGGSIKGAITAPFKAMGEKLKGIGGSIKGAITAPFKAIGAKLKGLGGAMAAGLKNVGAAVGGALKNVGAAMLTPFKALGGLFGRKKKKKNPELKNISDALKRIEDVINRVEEVFADYIGYLAKNFKKLLDKVKNVFVKWWLGVLIEIIVPTLIIIGALLYLLAEPLMKILQPVMDFIENIVGKILDFVAPIRDAILNVILGTWNMIKAPLEGLFRGIGTVAESLGKAIGKLVIGIADFAVDVLMPFLRDVVLPVLGSLLNVIKLFFDGFATIAFEVGKAFGELVLAIVKVAKQIVDFATEVVGLLTDIVKIVRKPIQMLADFFEGLGSKAREIGVKMGEVVLVALDVIKGILEGIRDNLDGLINIVRLYVVAPITGIQRKMKGLMVELAEKFSFKIPNISWVGISEGGIKVTLDEVHPFKFLTGGMTEEQKLEALADAEKPVSELIGEEMGKMQQKIEAENKAKELDALNQKIQQQKMQTFLENLNVVDDIYKLVKDIHTHLLGEKKTAETLAMKAAVPAFQKLESIKEQQVKQQEGLGEQLEAEKAQAKEETGDKAASERDLFGFLEGKFAAVMEKLDNPAVIPMPLPDRTVNYAGMEDR